MHAKKTDKKRIDALAQYQIMDTAPDAELDEISKLAGLICDTPISLVSLLDGKRQWFKSKHGLAATQTPQKDSFCQYALHKPNEVLEVQDALQDNRFIDNVLVTGDPHIRFYAGAPLVTPDHQVLGTLCVIDRNPKKLTENQKEALKMLAKKVMDILNSRRVIQHQKTTIADSADKIKKLTDRAPGMVYQFRMNSDKVMKFEFVSAGVSELFPGLTRDEIMENPEVTFNAIHPEDREHFLESGDQSFYNLTPWEVEYRVTQPNGKISWLYGKSMPQKKADGSVVWYGSWQDITSRKEYEHTLEDIVQDLTHVLRRPVTSLVSLLRLVDQEKELNEEKLKKYAKHMHTLAEELHEYTLRLNQDYELKRNRFALSSAKP